MIYTCACSHLAPALYPFADALRRLRICSMVVNFIALIIITFLGGIIYFGLERKNVRRACWTCVRVLRCRGC
jgi:hypothetical protein